MPNKEDKSKVIIFAVVGILAIIVLAPRFGIELPVKLGKGAPGCVLLDDNGYQGKSSANCATAFSQTEKEPDRWRCTRKSSANNKVRITVGNWESESFNFNLKCQLIDDRYSKTYFFNK